MYLRHGILLCGPLLTEDCTSEVQGGKLCHRVPGVFWHAQGMTVLDVNKPVTRPVTSPITRPDSVSGGSPSSSRPLSVPRAVALYVGALFGPGLLMLPGLAAWISWSTTV